MTTFRERGFTAVELLVAIIIGVLFITSAYQLYNVGTKTSADTLRRASASNAAYAILRSTQASVAALCSASAAVDVAIPSEYSATLPSAKATMSKSCPYDTKDTSGNTIQVAPLTLITVKITYYNKGDSASKEVVHAIVATK